MTKYVHKYSLKHKRAHFSEQLSNYQTLMQSDSHSEKNPHYCLHGYQIS